MDVANIIAQQMGGYSRLKAMVNGRDFVADECSLGFRFMKGSKKINYIRITLNKLDLYDVEFIWIRGVKWTTVKEVNGIYNDMLIDLFERETQLALTL